MTHDEVLQFFVADSFLRRARWIIGLLMLNWVALGLVLGASFGSRPALAIAAGVGGVLTLVIGSGQLRAAKFAGDAPLIEIGPERFRVRYYSSKVFRSVAMDDLREVRRQGGVLELVGKNGERQAVALRGLSKEDRKRVASETQARLEQRSGS
ncbi:MAG: hypothetical protein AAGA81_07000 [Acidobacteriota bacterium]